MASTSTWVITTDGSHPLAHVSSAVAQAGGQVQSSLSEVGILVANGTAAQAARWRKLPGVAAVEADQPIDIGPPGSAPT